ncbi:MAG: phosphoribosyltransferase family protein [Kiritimatiellae bacterium]|nr:phosphoribosyltransferase family protein [Kiritimatiellia bacterium]
MSQVAGKISRPVLIIDDVLDSGDTVRAVRRKIRETDAPVAVMCQKPWSIIKPDYCLISTEKWIIFPWE